MLSSTTNTESNTLFQLAKTNNLVPAEYTEIADDFEININPEKQETQVRNAYQNRLFAAKEAIELLYAALGSKEIPTEIEEKFKLAKQTLKKAATKTERQAALQSFLLFCQEQFVLKGYSPKSFRKMLEKADGYQTLKKRKPLFTLTEISNKPEGDQFYLAQIDFPLPALSDEMVEQYWQAIQCVKNNKAGEKAPAFYEKMSKEGKLLFNYIAKTRIHNQDDIKNTFSSLPCKDRELLGLANAYRSVTVIYKKNSENTNEIVHIAESLRSSMTASRDVDDELLQKQFALDNLKHALTLLIQREYDKNHAEFTTNDVFDEQKFKEHIKTLHILHNTLITPIFGTGFFTPDRDLYALKKWAIAQLNAEGFTVKIGSININFTKDDFAKIQETNFAINIGRYVERQGEESKLTKKETVGEDLYSEFFNLYNNLLKNPYIGNDLSEKNQRELFLAALQEVLYGINGDIYLSSCMSGKDREGLKRIYANAIRLFITVENKVPDIRQADTCEKFYGYVAQVFHSGHHQKIAGQNAPGTEGIKHITDYLPESLCKIINQDTNNKQEKATDICNELSGLMYLKRFMDKMDEKNSKKETCIKYTAVLAGALVAGTIGFFIHPLVAPIFAVVGAFAVKSAIEGWNKLCYRFADAERLTFFATNPIHAISSLWLSNDSDQKKLSTKS